MTELTSTLRADDRAALRAALREVRRQTGLPVAFGGEVSGGTLRLTELLGMRTNGLRNLDVCSGAGLGGRVIAEGRPGGVDDYGQAQEITHEYDRPVLAEGIWSVAAVPVTVRGAPRAVMYAATRERHGLGDRVKAFLARAGQNLAEELTIRHEVERQLAMSESLSAATRPEVGNLAQLEEVRIVHTELRAIAQSLPDDELRGRLYAACRRLARLGADDATDNPTVGLSPRETDVLAQVSLGCSNAEAARHLALRAQTVKSYLYSAMRKLDAHTRHEAVVRARRLHQLP